jgi:hypothetical protein
MTRLAFVRMLFLQGIDQSQQPEPLNATSVLSLHDASELLLGAIADHLGVSLPKQHVGFMDHWKYLGPAQLPGGSELPLRQRMDRVNDVRNALKHKGTLPSKTAIELTCADVGAFLEDSTLLVFGLDFAAIDMADVVPQENARTHVKAAAAAEAAGNRKEAMVELAEAFAELFGSLAGSGFGSAYGFGRTVRCDPFLGFNAMIQWLAKGLPQGQDRRGTQNIGRNVDRHLSEITEAVASIQRGMRVVALGNDYGRYNRFEQLTPKVYGTDDNRRVDVDAFYAPTRDEYDDCVQFVISVALRVADLETQSARPSWRRQ